MAKSTNHTNVGDLRAGVPFRTSIKPEHSTETKSVRSRDASSQAAATAKARRTFPLSSYNWSDDYEPLTIDEDNLLPVQSMIITEFQPDYHFLWSAALTDAGVGLLKGALSSALPGVSDAVAKVAKAGIKSAGQEILNNVQKTYEADPNKALGVPMKFVKQLFSGHYLASYEVPFFSPVYLAANTSNGWSAAGASAVIGEDLASLVKENLSVDIPTTPQWSAPSGSDKGAMTIEFNLINNSEDSLIKNFKFLNSFISGAFWLQMGYAQKSPNVYDIEVPGRFHLYYASMGVKIQQMGKLRTCERMTDEFEDFHSITSTTLWPDVYAIEVTIDDLCPNNFNTYLDYLKNGTSKQVVIGKQITAYNIKSVATDLVGGNFGNAEDTDAANKKTKEAKAKKAAVKKI